MQTLRNLARSPGFTLPVVAIFALSIAANTAIFSIFNGLFLTSLPFPHADRLLYVDETATATRSAGLTFPYQDFDVWRRSSGAFENIAAFITGGGVNLSTPAGAVRVNNSAVSYNMAATLGLKPILGRDFLPSEDRQSSAKVVLLTYGFWQRQFARRPDVIGQIITVDNVASTIVGVLPKNAVFPGNTDIWQPIGPFFPGDKARIFLGIARMKSGITLEQARADLLRVDRQIPRPANRATTPVLAPLRDRFVSDYRLVTEALLAGVALILLIACINVAGLMLARGRARSREFAIRGALGAGRGRLLRQLLGETVLLAFIGSSIGVALGWAALRSTVVLLPDTLPSWINFPLDLHVICFSIAVTAAAAVLSGFAPAFQFSKVDLRDSLADAAPKASLTRGRKRAMNALIVGEIAVAFILLAAGGLMVKAFHHVLTVDPGFKPQSVLTFSLDPAWGSSNDKDRVPRFYDELLSRLRSLPGVHSAAAVVAYNLPMGNGKSATRLARVEGMARPDPNQPYPSALFAAVTPDYFKTMGIVLKSGRDFDDHDRAEGPIIVDEAFVHRFWPGEKNVLGKRVTLSGTEHEFMTVVGVVETVRHDGLDRDLRPGVYGPANFLDYSHRSIVLRGAIDLAAVREAIRQMDSAVALFDVQTMQARVDHSLWMRRAYSSIFAVFAGIALILAVAGIYGVVSYTVTQRTREIGIRMALGAKPAQLVRQVLRQGMAVVAMGLVIGTTGAIFATRFLESLLAGVSAHDTWTFLAVGATLLAAAFFANFAPARRAALVDPIRALRNE